MAIKRYRHNLCRFALDNYIKGLKLSRFSLKTLIL